MRIVRHADLVPAPWKNGGGITREALRSPPAGERFGWRVSFAQVDASGPFSDFSGYARHLVLLRGAGVVLHFGAGRQAALRAPGDLAQFDGGTPTRGELLGGSCADLNLICDAARYTVDARVVELAAPCLQEPAAGETVLIVPIDGGVRVSEAGCSPAQLGPWDLAAGRVSRIDPLAPCRVFLARIVDNGTP